jgi:hypothetical protein
VPKKLNKAMHNGAFRDGSGSRHGRSVGRVANSAILLPGKDYANEQPIAGMRIKRRLARVDSADSAGKRIKRRLARVALVVG